MTIAAFALRPLMNLAVHVDGVKIGYVFVLIVDALLGEKNTLSIGAYLGIGNEVKLEQVIGLDRALGHIVRIPSRLSAVRLGVAA